MLNLDHVAIQSPDIPASIRYYQQSFGATVLYQDKTWAYLKIGDIKIALVTPGEHPSHFAFRVSREELEAKSRQLSKAIVKHRDNTEGMYIVDPHGNTLELIHYPPDAKV